MIKLITFLFVFFSMVNISFPAEYFDAERLNIDFYGVCGNSNVIIAYGSGGVILISSDKGQNWSQRKIFDDSVSIKKIIPFKDGFIGLTYSQIVFSLDKEAGSMQSKPADKYSPQFDLTSDGNTIYCLSNSYIYEMNDDLEIIKAEKIQVIPKPNSIQYFKDKLYISTDSCLIYSYNIKDNYSFSEHNISLYGPSAYSFRNGGDNLYAVMGGKIYKTSDGKTWELMQNLGGSSSYAVRNDDIIILNIIYENPDKPRKLECYSVDKEKVLTKIGQNTDGRFAIYNKLSHEFIDDSVIVAAGPLKTIFVSADRGRNWQLKSNLNIYRETDIGKIITLDENVFYYAAENKIYRTSNSGATWLPQIFTDTLTRYFRYSNILHLGHTGKGFVCTSKLVTYKDSAKDMNILYTVDSGNTFRYRYIHELKYGDPLMQSPVLAIPGGYRLFLSPTVIINQMQSTLLLDLDSDFNLKRYFYLDSIKILDFVDHGSGQITAFAEENRYPTGYDKFDSTKYWLMNSKDYGDTWEKQFQCKIDSVKKLIVADWKGDNLLVFYDTGFFDTLTLKFYDGRKYFYNLDLTDNSVYPIYSDTTNLNKIEFVLNNKVYLKNYRGELLCFSNINSKIPSIDTFYLPINDYKVIWDYLIPKGGDFIFARILTKDNNLMLYKIRRNEQLTVEENESETDSYIYARNPWPMPAANIVRVMVFELSDKDITTANISIYDYLGNKVSNGSEVERTAHSFYQGEIAWDCSSVAPGVYFINFDFGTVRTTVPVVVAR